MFYKRSHEKFRLKIGIISKSINIDHGYDLGINNIVIGFVIEFHYFVTNTTHHDLRLMLLIL